MRLLLIGGTRFVGRAIAEAGVAAGHEVTVLHRGTTNVDLARAEHLLTDRDKDLSVLDGRRFDATVDVCAYLPGQVGELADALEGRGGHHVFISTMSVYAEADAPGLTEDSALVEAVGPEVDEVTNETYGGLKVSCERAAAAAYGEDNLTVVRPTYVVGPEDYTFRYPYWVRRVASGGEVLAPGPADSPVQVVDARDLGAWAVQLAERRTSGFYNALGTSLPFGFCDLLTATAEAVAPEDTTLTWVDGSWLRDLGVDGRQLPLWNEGSNELTLAGDNSRALSTGLRPRPVQETAADTLEWIRRTGGEPGSGMGLSRSRESEILAEWYTRVGAGGADPTTTRSGADREA